MGVGRLPFKEKVTGSPPGSGTCNVRPYGTSVNAMARAHVVLSEETLRRVDANVGKRERSRFIEDAAREKLDRIELEKALDATFGVARGPGYRHWKDRRTVAEWVRRTRRTEGR